MFRLHQSNPRNEFTKHWELVPALTPELREEVYRIRHDVYCTELGFEQANAEGREKDEYDSHSCHLLIRCGRTGAWAGCVRLVLRPKDRPEMLLPSEKVCGATIAGRLVDPKARSCTTIAEISRLALVRAFRHARLAHQGHWPEASNMDALAYPGALYVRLALYLGATAWAHRLGFNAILFLTEPRLATRLRKFGLPFEQVSTPFEHRGMRVLSLAHIDDPILRLPSHLRPLYRAIESEIDHGLEIHHPVPKSHRHAKGHTQHTQTGSHYSRAVAA